MGLELVVGFGVDETWEGVEGYLRVWGRRIIM